MRRDMQHVVNEPARRKSHRYSSSLEFHNTEVVSPMRESMRLRHRYHRESKPQQYSLTPIRRFLERRRGHPWNAVFSELCSCPAGRKPDVLRAQVRTLVAVDTYLSPEGLALANCSQRGVRLAGDVAAFFVDPKTGTLEAKGVVEASAAQGLGTQVAPVISRRDIGILQQLHCLDGLWFKITLGRIPRQVFEPESHLDGVSPTRDVILGSVYKFKPSTLEARLRTLYGRSTVWGIKKQQLSHEELRSYGVSNIY